MDIHFIIYCKGLEVEVSIKYKGAEKQTVVDKLHTHSREFVICCRALAISSARVDFEPCTKKNVIKMLAFFYGDIRDKTKFMVRGG